jgi:hypothetical protein
MKFRHANVQHYGVEARSLQLVESLIDSTGSTNDEPFVSEESFQRLSHARLIIDHEDPRTDCCVLRQSHTVNYRRLVHFPAHRPGRGKFCR